MPLMNTLPVIDVYVGVDVDGQAERHKCRHRHRRKCVDI